MEFTYYQPTKIIFGENKINSLPQHILCYGKKAFVIGPILCDAIQPLFQRMEKVLESSHEISYKTFYQVEPNPSIDTVDSALQQIRYFQPDIIIGIGGGSVIDVSKICSLLYANAQFSWKFLFEQFNDFHTQYETIHQKLPLIAVPTTSGTGSQCTQACVLTDTDHLKKTIFHQDLFANLTILDSTLTLSLPKRMTKATAFDALSHSLESFLRIEHPICNQLAKEGIAKIFRNLPLLLQENNTLYRGELMVADTFGGISLSNCGAMLPHPLSEIIGSYSNICHGEALALVYPAFLKNTIDKYTTKYAALAKYLFPSKVFDNEYEAANYFIQAMLQFMDNCGLALTISDYQINQDTIKMIYNFIINLNLPMESPQTIKKILNEIFDI